jgi:peptidoglycan-associated lipoprotein
MRMRKPVLAMTVCAIAVAGSTACATKGYVREQTGQVNSKVDTLATSLEDTQERTAQNETKIAQVDTAAGAAASSAASAGTAAGLADQRAGAADERATAAGAKAEAVEKAINRVIYEVVLSENQGNFTFGGSALPDTLRTRVDEMVSQMKADPKGAYFEIEGHTDNVGDAATNQRIGLARAETVKRFLYEQHQIPLHRMNVISYGEDKPVSPNTTRDGRAANRRVVIRVLG